MDYDGLKGAILKMAQLKSKIFSIFMQINLGD